MAADTGAALDMEWNAFEFSADNDGPQQTEAQVGSLFQSNVSPLLMSLVDRNTDATDSLVDNTLFNRLMWDQLDRVDVHFSGEDVTSILQSAIELGFEPLYVDQSRSTVDGWLPVEGIVALEQLLQDVSVGVEPNLRPQTSAGLVSSEADIVMQTRRLRDALPTAYDGSGMRIGVISDSYNNLGGANADVASGDLPADVTVLQDLASGGSDEGRAMMQLVYDLAPAATLGFATAFIGGQAGFAANIVGLANTFNADVIVDDIFYFAEPYFQDGVIAQAIDNVALNSDVAYFSSAGNLQDQAFEMSAPFANGSTTFGLGTFGTGNFTATNALDLDPGAGVDFRQSITLTAGQEAILGLQWDAPFFASVLNNLDLFLVDQATNVLVAVGATNNINNDQPVELLGFTNNTGATRTYEVIVNRAAGTNPGRIKWVNFGANGSGPITTIEYDTNSPTITPHSASLNAMSVGAVPYFDQRVPESFTSIGPSTILFDPNGNPIAETIRAKPDMAAIDGTNNTFFGGDAEGDGRPNFFGTSAAAPHAAAVAALVRQANPTFTSAQTYDRMKQTATDLGAVGADNVTGTGLVNAYKAVFPTVARPTVPLTENFEAGLNQKWDVSSTGIGRVQVLSVDANGNNQLTMDTFRSGRPNSLNEAVLHFDATGVNDIELRFDQKELADEDDTMPATFIGSSLSDGVALSVDGTNWFRLVSLIGVNSTAAYINNRINLSRFALNAGITLGTDVRIKFQQYDNSPIPTDGMVFDNISIAKAPNEAPTFGQATYTFSIDETVISGAPVGTVSATDPNLGDSLVFSLSGTGANNFVINPTTGAVTVAPGAAFNAVLTPSYSMIVTVSDGQLQANVPLVVNVSAVIQVASTNVFYTGSRFATVSVEAALDSSKQLARSGAAALPLGYSNLLNTTMGINGLVLDIARMPGTTLAANDFVFRMSPQGAFNAASNPPSSWAAAPAPSGIFVTAATPTTPARVRLEWTNNAIANRWLQLQVLNTSSTGLPTTQVYYLGHLQGEMDGETVFANSFIVGNADLNLVRPIGTVASIDTARDLDKNGFVLNSDGVAIRNGINAGLTLRNITIPIAGSPEEGRVTIVPPTSAALATPFTGLGTGNNLRRPRPSVSQRLILQAATTSVIVSPTSYNNSLNTAAYAAGSLLAGQATTTAEKADAVFSNFEELDLAAAFPKV